MSKYVILGSGGFGLALAIAALASGNSVTVWSSFQEEIDTIRRDGEHKQKLPGVSIPEEIGLTSDISCVSGADAVIFGIPSPFVRDVAKKAAPYVTEKMIVINTGKGLEAGSLKRLSTVIEEEIPACAPCVVLSGPSHAEEVAIGVPTTVVAASKALAKAEFVQETLSTPTFRIYLNDDVIGCELGGALKNIIALSAGICDGMGYGDNTKAALMTRGMSEIAKLGVALGARPETFSGLTGLGDLIVTCTSMHSRNRRAGILIGQGVSADEAVKQVGTVEGYICCRIAWELMQSANVDMPITRVLYLALFDGKPVKDALSELMTRPKKHETEKYWMK